MKHMKKIKILSLTLGIVLAVITSCKDDSLVIVPEWESAVHGLGDFATGSAQNFVFGDPAVDIDLTLRWVSIDKKASVERMEVYALFNETYTDPDGVPATAKHGGDDGVLIATYEGASLPDNAEDIAFSVSQDAIYQLYKNNTFDYDKNPATSPTPVFNNPGNPDRSPSNPMVKGDVVQIRWEFTTSDGRLFNSWSPSVCNEFPGANCAVNWGVICVSDLGGTYDMVSTWTESGGSTGGGSYVTNLTATAVSGKYTIADLSGGMEPEFWGNPPVACTIIDECSTIKLDLTTFSYIYGYAINSGNVNPSTGVITIVWQNVYGENV